MGVIFGLLGQKLGSSRKDWHMPLFPHSWLLASILRFQLAPHSNSVTPLLSLPCNWKQHHTPTPTPLSLSLQIKELKLCLEALKGSLGTDNSLLHRRRATTNPSFLSLPVKFLTHYQRSVQGQHKKLCKLYRLHSMQTSRWKSRESLNAGLHLALPVCPVTVLISLGSMFHYLLKSTLWLRGEP